MVPGLPALKSLSIFFPNHTCIFFYYFPLALFPATIQSAIATEILPNCIAKFDHAATFSQANWPILLSSAMQVLRGIFQHKEFVDLGLNLVHSTQLQNVAHKVISILDRRKDLYQLPYLLQDSIDLASSLCRVITSSQLLQVLSSLVEIIEHAPLCKLAIADFLGNCTGTKMDEARQTAIAQKLKLIIQSLLTDPDRFVKTAGLRNLNQFLKFSDYAQFAKILIPQSLVSTVVSYISGERLPEFTISLQELLSRRDELLFNPKNTTRKPIDMISIQEALQTPQDHQNNVDTPHFLPHQKLPATNGTLAHGRKADPLRKALSSVKEILLKDIYPYLESVTSDEVQWMEDELYDVGKICCGIQEYLQENKRKGKT